MSKPLQLDCPQCNKAVLWNDDYPQRPFCSERCKLIDLGAWANEEHVIAGPPITDFDDVDLNE